MRQRLAEKKVDQEEKVRLKPDTTGATGKAKTTKPAARPKKLSYKEQRELDELPALIEALESEQRALAQRIAAPEFYKAGAETIKQSLARVDTLQTELTAVYARWGDLDARKDQGPRTGD